jgi:hypothetical protein
MPTENSAECAVCGKEFLFCSTVLLFSSKSGASVCVTMARGALYWTVLSVLAILTFGAASLLGIGLAYLDEANAWTRTACSVSDSLSIGIVNSSCSPFSFVVLLKSDNDTSVFLSDPVSVYSDAVSQMESLVVPFNTSCWTRKGTTMLYPEVCDSCGLTCTNYTLNPQYVQSASVSSFRPLAMLFIAIGSPIAAVSVVCVCVFLVLFQLREESLRRVAALLVPKEDD